MAFVFQYGSNACTSLLNSQSRLNGAAEPLGIAKTVEDYDIVFDVYSDTSRCAAADIVNSKDRKVWGVIYKIPDELLKDRDETRSKLTLPQVIGRRYYKKNILVEKPDGNIIKVITFAGKELHKLHSPLPTCAEYVTWIITGLREYNVSEEYIAHILEVAVNNNKSAITSIENEIELIQKLNEQEEINLP